jgi:ring-1,2-phenylacetyl-CoA epoxidase subunit PaaC
VRGEVLGRLDGVTTLIAHGDDNLVLAQRLGEWISNAPELEEDIALGNIALDHLGVARALYTLAGEMEGRGRSEDDFAMGRPEREFLNLILVEQPNGDFAHTMVRGLLFDAYQVELWDTLAGSDGPLTGIATRAGKEARYHLRHSSAWVVRLGDGTEESHRRSRRALDLLWRYTDELFEGPTPVSRGRWQATVEKVLAEAGLSLPADPYQRSGGRHGLHSEHLGPLLAEMQWMQRSYPGMEW